MLQNVKHYFPSKLTTLIVRYLLIKKKKICRNEIEALFKIFRKLIVINKTKSSQGKLKPNANASSVIGKPTNVQEV